MSKKSFIKYLSGHFWDKVKSDSTDFLWGIGMFIVASIPISTIGVAIDCFLPMSDSSSVFGNYVLFVACGILLLMLLLIPTVFIFHIIDWFKVQYSAWKHYNKCFSGTYHVMETCNQCCGTNKVTVKDSIEHTTCEAETVCEDCGFKDYWSTGFFESSQYGYNACEKY